MSIWTFNWVNRFRWFLQFDSVFEVALCCFMYTYWFKHNWKKNYFTLKLYNYLHFLVTKIHSCNNSYQHELNFLTNQIKPNQITDNVYKNKPFFIIILIASNWFGWLLYYVQVVTPVVAATRPGRRPGRRATATSSATPRSTSRPRPALRTRTATRRQSGTTSANTNGRYEQY